jgi:hypothetical protein
MKALLATALLVGCAVSPATGIPGDTSPDNPTAPPDETGGKADKSPKKVVYGKGVVMGAPTVVHVYWGAYWLTDAGTADRAVLDGFEAMIGQSTWWQITNEYPDKAGTVPGAPSPGAPAFASDSEPPSRLH